MPAPRERVPAQGCLVLGGSGLGRGAGLRGGGAWPRGCLVETPPDSY